MASSTASCKRTWIRRVPKRVAAESDGDLDKSSPSSRLMRSIGWRSPSRLVLYDSSDRTDPLSEEFTDSSSHHRREEDELDRKRPQHVDIASLSAAFAAATTASAKIEEEPLCDAAEDSCLVIDPVKEDSTEHSDVDENDDDDDGSLASFYVLKSPQSGDMTIAARPCLVTDSMEALNLSKKSTGSKSVCFSTIEVREYARCAGDNPSVTSGIPLSIGWTVAAQHYPVSVDDYEAHHPHNNGYSRTRSLSRFQVGAVDRMHMLMQWGYSRGELKEYIQQVDVCRAQRKETVQRLRGDFFLKRWFRKLLRRRSKTNASVLDDDSFHNVVDDPAHV